MGKMRKILTGLGYASSMATGLFTGSIVSRKVYEKTGSVEAANVAGGATAIGITYAGTKLVGLVDNKTHPKQYDADADPYVQIGRLEHYIKHLENLYDLEKAERLQLQDEYDRAKKEQKLLKGKYDDLNKMNDALMDHNASLMYKITDMQKEYDMLEEENQRLKGDE